MDSTGHMHQGSVFGYILVYALAPTGANARASYMRAFPLIAVHPQLYTEAMADYDYKSSVAFQAISNYTFPLYRLHMEPTQAKNLGKTEVLQHFLANQIPQI